MRNNGFTLCANQYIDQLKLEGRHPTAHVYKNALRSFAEFCGSRQIAFSQLTRDNLHHYSRYLLARNKKLNTVSTYMRMLRSVYNRAVDRNLTPYIHRLFRNVFTGVDTCHKKALPAGDLHALLYTDPQSEELRRTQNIANLLFQFSGMSFADLAHLEKKDLQQGVLTYYRVKTGTSVSVEILDSAKEMVAALSRRGDPCRPDAPHYLFSILSGENRRQDELGYKEYQSALRKFNNQLKRLARACHLYCPVTSYSLRHSWATIAKYRGVPIEVISESLGHKSIKTTQIYLKGFELGKRTEVNKMNNNYVKNYCS